VASVHAAIAITAGRRHGEADGVVCKRGGGCGVGERRGVGGGEALADGDHHGEDRAQVASSG
jgi:hypothetical protein